MNSLERVRAASERKKTDRPCSGLRCTPEAWKSLRDYFGAATNNEVLDILDIDLRFVSARFIGPQEKSAVPLGSEGYDFWGCHTRAVTNEFNTYFEFDYHPLESAESLEAIEGHDWPDIDWWDFSSIREQAAEHDLRDTRAHIFFAGGTFETPWYIRGLERFLLDMYEHPEFVDAICTRVGDHYQERAFRAIDQAGEYFHMVGSGGDIGTQRGMMLAPDMWRKHIKRHAKRLIMPFRERGYMTFYHSCGSLVPVIEDFIEIGLQFLEPIQVTAAGMQPDRLFEQFGERLSFHGAVDEVELLPHATSAEVYDATLDLIDQLGGNHGFIVAPSHQVQGDTPPENVEAIYRAVADYPRVR